MYLRQSALFKSFVVEKKTVAVDAQGRTRNAYAAPLGTISAVLAKADPKQQERWNQLQHPISHIITQKGRPRAETEDRLTLGNRRFYIHGIDEPGELGLWTIYFVEERFDEH